MVGKPHTRTARERLEELRASKALTPSTERRTEPEPFSVTLIPELLSLSRIGYTFAEIADHWSIAEETLEAWGESGPTDRVEEKEAHLAFNEALRRARTACKACWQGWAREAMAYQDNKFPAGAWSQAMSAMFPGYDKKDRVGITFDITRNLIMMDLRTAEPLSEQTVGDPNPLIEHGPARLVASQTGESGLDLDLSAPAAAQANGSSGEKNGQAE